MTRDLFLHVCDLGGECGDSRPVVSGCKPLLGESSWTLYGALVVLGRTPAVHQCPKEEAVGGPKWRSSRSLTIQTIGSTNETVNSCFIV